MSVSLPLINSGKVREIYDAGDSILLIVASNRISAFDVILDKPIPEKGKVLTAMTYEWLKILDDLCPNHLISVNPKDFPLEAIEAEQIAGRTMLVKKAQMLPIECIVRGYLSGSAYKEYQKTSTVHGVPIEKGLLESAKLPEPIFTPSTKAEVGHDENISYEQAVDLVGKEVAEKARDISLKAYEVGAKLALEKGIIVADTKFELGFIDGELAICDEVLTPDSSRFWATEDYSEGSTPPSYDKQPVRDWLESTGWDKNPPAPELPNEVVEATSNRYKSAYELIFSKSLNDWI